jgi:outer membrane receptor for ferrienterochelin and colicins
MSQRPLFCRAGILSLLFLCEGTVLAASGEDIERVHQNVETIGIATGHQVPLNLAPAVATVITAQDLESIGATTLSEALALVPGVYVLDRRQGDHFIFRGIRSDSNFNPDWSLMVDGVPQNDVLFGNQRQFIGDMPLQSIDRIEVIRGPGSALYGADAFAGTVNIITKRPGDVSNSQLSVRGGSFDTGEVRYQQPNKFFGISSLFSLQVKTTDGPRPLVAMDAQTFWDRRLGTNASLAPARRETWENDYNLNWDLQKDEWRLRWHHRERKFADSIGGALDPGGFFTPKVDALDLLYDKPNFASNWDLRSNVSWWKYDADSHNTRVYPAGAFRGTFPDGVFDEIGFTEDRVHTEINALYRGIADHSILIGLGAERNRVYDVRERRNFILPLGGLPIPLGQIVELGPNDVFAPTTQRTLYFTYLQDEWAFARDWTLTSGLRHDGYSDFGSTTNPRLALVWATSADLTTKFLAGQAFRAPTFLDLDSRNNPAIVGNPDLKPETIKTYEVSFDYRPTPQLRTGLNFFYHNIYDKIRAIGGTLTTSNENVGKQTGKGGEWEWKWNITNELVLNGWYARQRNTVENGTDPGFAPHKSASARLDWRFLPNWSFNTNALWVADRDRPVDDVRSQLPDYWLFDITLRYRRYNSPWAVGFSVFNIFNKLAFDPGDPPGRDRSDNMLPGRAAFIEVRYNPPW